MELQRGKHEITLCVSCNINSLYCVLAAYNNSPGHSVTLFENCYVKATSADSIHFRVHLLATKLKLYYCIADSTVTMRTAAHVSIRWSKRGPKLLLQRD
jgi:hypothetical protein